MRMPLAGVVFLLFGLVPAMLLPCDRVHAGDPDVLTLATTTSTDNSGLLAAIHPLFERATGIRIKVIAKGTGAALQLGRDGNADVVLVHARKHEDAFIAEGFGCMRRDVMYNDFVIVGPAADPAGIRGTRRAAAALAGIAAANALFVSRGDASGTHIREQALWRETGLTLLTKRHEVVRKGRTRVFEMVLPAGDWYRSVGRGMAQTLHFATEKRGYALADRGTYYACALATPARTDLAILCQGDPELMNPYGVMMVNPARHPRVNQAAARRYIEWLTSPAVQKRIGDFRVGGRVLFHPGVPPAARTRAVSRGN